MDHGIQHTVANQSPRTFCIIGASPVVSAPSRQPIPEQTHQTRYFLLLLTKAKKKKKTRRVRKPSDRNPRLKETLRCARVQSGKLVARTPGWLP